MPDWINYIAATGSSRIVIAASGLMLMENNDVVLAENGDRIIYER